MLFNRTSAWWSLHESITKAHLHFRLLCRSQLKHSIMYVYFGVLMMYAILKYTQVSKEGMPSINGPSIDFKWQSRCCHCVSGSDWVAWKDRMIQQRGKSVSPSNTVIGLHQETLGTDYAYVKQLFLAVPAVCLGWRKRGQWLECHSRENWKYCSKASNMKVNRLS